MKRHLSILNTEDSTLCGPCGGLCCKSLPGTTHPEEWGSTREEIREAIHVALASGRWSIDWWEGDPRPGVSYESDEWLPAARYLRPRRVGADVIDAKWNWEKWPCTFLRDDGCLLRHDQRPSECRSLMPSADSSQCRPESDEFTKQSNAIAWIPYQDLIEQAMRLY